MWRNTNKGQTSFHGSPYTYVASDNIRNLDMEEEDSDKDVVVGRGLFDSEDKEADQDACYTY